MKSEIVLDDEAISSFGVTQSSSFGAAQSSSFDAAQSSSFDAAQSSSFGAASSSSSNGLVYYDASDRVVSPNVATKPPLPALSSSSSASNQNIHNNNSPRHVCAAFTGDAGVTARFGADFRCVVCGNKAPKAAATRRREGGGAERSRESRRNNRRREARNSVDGLEDVTETNLVARDSTEAETFLKKFKRLRKLRSRW